jgi:ElaB/YqjD/DUF883 family membrane-anchored ribosome-binding protein
MPNDRYRTTYDDRREMTDIVERLRRAVWPPCQEAADEIEQLRQNVERALDMAAKELEEQERLRGIIDKCAKCSQREVDGLRPHPRA